MNKGVIVLLAVCLVSVHAMVKRDAPAAAPADGNNLAALEKQFKDFTASIGKQLQSINGEEIQKSINDAINNLKKTVNDLTKPTEAKQ